jgi:hypothetical protein
MRMTAICQEETHRAKLLDETAPVAEPNGSVSYGISCVNSIHLQPGGLLEGWDPERLHRDHLYNLKAAFVVSDGGNDFSPWTTFRNGLEKQNVELAKVAIDGAARVLGQRTLIASYQAERGRLLTRAAEADEARDEALTKMAAARDAVRAAGEALA